MKKKAIPKFATEDEERNFWASQDATEYFDLSQAKPVIFPNLKPSVKSISIRLPQDLLDSIKVLANKRDIPYQSFMKTLLTEAVEREVNKTR